MLSKIEIEEVSVFIAGVRRAESKSWWVGIYDPNTESPDLVSTSLRGFFQESYWKPVKDEHAGECCDAIHSEIKDGKQDDDAFAWMTHCEGREHVELMLERRLPEQLEAEYQYMLETTLSALEQNL